MTHNAHIQLDQSPSAYAIEPEGLTKTYGTFEAVRGLSIQVPPADSLGLHQSEHIHTAGVSLATARAAIIMVHGRGATAESILTLVPAFDMDGFAFLAPQAFGNTWYPNSFLRHFSPTNRDYRRVFRQLAAS